MNGPMRIAWVLVAFVIALGAVLWAVSGRAVFAVFVVLGVVTGVGAWLTGRSESTSKKEIP